MFFLKPLDTIHKDRRNKEGMFFSFGDSISNAFMSSLTSGPYSGLCKVVFGSCQSVYHWVYDMQGYWGDGVKSPREPVPDERDYDHERVISDVKKVSPTPGTVTGNRDQVCCLRISFDCIQK